MGGFALLLCGIVLALLLTGRLKRDGATWIGGALGALVAVELLVRGQVLLAVAAGGLTVWHVWRQRLKGRVAALSMDEMEARRVLGIGPYAGRADILAAHRRLIAQVHPDKGGSQEHARRVNAARDLLLKL